MNHSVAPNLDGDWSEEVFPVLGGGRAEHRANRPELDGPDPLPGEDRHIRATTISFGDMHEHGDLLASFFRARKRVFIDELQWNLPNIDGFEFDQYDTPFSRWVVIHEFGQVLGGLRLTPTVAKVGIYSYMLRDAQRGLLENIPTDVLFFKAPVSETVWEGTRLFISDEVGAERRHRIQKILMHRLLETADELNVRFLIGFVPSLWYRWTKRIGLNAVAAGPRVNIDGIISQSALMNVRECLPLSAKLIKG